MTEHYTPRYKAAIKLIEAATREELVSVIRNSFDLIFASGSGDKDDPNDIGDTPSQAFLDHPYDIPNCFAQFLPETTTKKKAKK